MTFPPAAGVSRGGDFVWWSFVVGCVPVPRGPVEQVPPGPLPVSPGVVGDSALAARVDPKVLAYLEATGKPGVAVVLFDAGRVTYACGYGWADLAERRPLTADTPVLWSSVSKTVIAVAAYQGIEAGRLSMDSPVRELVGFPVDNPRVEGETVRLRHLLTHTSGVRDSLVYLVHYDFGDPLLALAPFLRGYLTEGGEHWTHANYARAMPGATSAYSNAGASLAALGIATAAGVEFADLVRRDILEPLGMDGAWYFERDATAPAATLYDPAGGGFRAYAPYSYPGYPEGLLHAGAEDLGRFGAALLGGGAGERGTVLTPASIDEMWSPMDVPQDEQAAEFGLRQAALWYEQDLGPHRVTGHSGGDLGSATQLFVDRERGVGFGLLFNTALADLDEYDAMVELEVELLDLASEGR